MLNTRSLNNKALITDNNLDFHCITETWHTPLDYFSQNQTTLPGFPFIKKAHPESRGDGVAAVYRKDIETSPILTFFRLNILSSNCSYLSPSHLPQISLSSPFSPMSDAQEGYTAMVIAGCPVPFPLVDVHYGCIPEVLWDFTLPPD